MAFLLSKIKYPASYREKFFDKETDRGYTKSIYFGDEYRGSALQDLPAVLWRGNGSRKMIRGNTQEATDERLHENVGHNGRNALLAWWGGFGVRRG